MCLNYKFIEYKIYRLLSNNLKIACMSRTKPHFLMIKCNYVSSFSLRGKKNQFKVHHEIIKQLLIKEKSIQKNSSMMSLPKVDHLSLVSWFFLSSPSHSAHSLRKRRQSGGNFTLSYLESRPG